MIKKLLFTFDIELGIGLAMHKIPLPMADVATI